MGIQESITATTAPEMSDRDTLRQMRALAERFSGHGYAFDDLIQGIEEVAEACAEADGWPEFDRADRYLAPDMFVPLTDAQFYGSRFGG